MTEALLHGAAAVLLPPGVWYLWRLARRMPEERTAAAPGPPDTVAASALALWFVALIADSQGREAVVNISAIMGSAIVYGTIVGLLVFFLKVRGIPVAEFLGLRFPPGRQVLGTAMAALAASLPVIYLIQWSASLVFGPETARQPLLVYWMEEAGLGGRALVVLMAMGIAPVAEEVIFRGYLFRVAERYAGRWAAIVAVSLLFAGVHVHLPAMGGLFVLAVVLNILYCVTGSLWAPIAAHAVFNMFTLIFSLAWPESS